MDDSELKALVLVCSLTKSPTASSSELLAKHMTTELTKLGVLSNIIRTVDYDIKPGVETDMGEGDDWPKLRQQMLDADILILSVPIWVGHPSSQAQKVIERLDAELSETDDQGRLLTYGKVAAVGVVGNEDGAHKVIADMFQALNDVGFTIPAASGTYWVGEAMQSTDYKDLEEVPEKTQQATKALAANVAHLARLLKSEAYPASE